MSIWTDIGKFFSKIWHSFQPVAKKAVDLAVTIVNGVKTVDTSMPGVLDALTALIPGTTDDKAKEWLRANIARIALELNLIDATLELTDPEEIALAAIKAIQAATGDTRTVWLKNLSAMLAVAAADGKLTINDAFDAVSWYYKHKDDPEVDTELNND